MAHRHPLGSDMCPNSIYFGLEGLGFRVSEVPILGTLGPEVSTSWSQCSPSFRYFRAKVYTSWVHGPGRDPSQAQSKLHQDLRTSQREGAEGLGYFALYQQYHFAITQTHNMKLYNLQLELYSPRFVSIPAGLIETSCSPAS